MSLASALRRHKMRAALKRKGIHVAKPGGTKKKKKKKKAAKKKTIKKKAAPKKKRRAKATTGREAFIRSVMHKGQSRAQAAGLWKARHARRKKKGKKKTAAKKPWHG